MRSDEERRLAEETAQTVASASECTGLVPALTDAAGEAAERELYDVQRPARHSRKDTARKG